MEASRFQWDDYEHGLTDLDGLKDTLAFTQSDHSTLIERVTSRSSSSPPR